MVLLLILAIFIRPLSQVSFHIVSPFPRSSTAPLPHSPIKLGYIKVEKYGTLK